MGEMHRVNVPIEENAAHMFTLLVCLTVRIIRFWIILTVLVACRQSTIRTLPTCNQNFASSENTSRHQCLILSLCAHSTCLSLQFSDNNGTNLG